MKTKIMKTSAYKQRVEYETPDHGERDSKIDVLEVLTAIACLSFFPLMYFLGKTIMDLIGH